MSFPLRLLVLRTPEEIARGLSGLRDLPPDAGALFLLPAPSREPFWNKGTHVKLSIAFLSPAGYVLGLRRMRSIEETGGRIEWYASPSPYVAALEVPRGWFEARGIREGSRIRVSLSPRSPDPPTPRSPA